MKASWIVVALVPALSAGMCSEPRGIPGDDGTGTGRCSTMITSGDRCEPATGRSCTWSEGIDGGGGSSPVHRCDCLGDTWQCITIDNPCPGGGLPSSDATCNAGDTCEYADWEHDCSCGCAANHRWDCTPGTIGSSQVCPRAYLDAGVDAP